MKTKMGSANHNEQCIHVLRFFGFFFSFLLAFVSFGNTNGGAIEFCARKAATNIPFALRLCALWAMEVIEQSDGWV